MDDDDGVLWQGTAMVAAATAPTGRVGYFRALSACQPHGDLFGDVTLASFAMGEHCLALWQPCNVGFNVDVKHHEGFFCM
jgi:hypothetical protein